MEGTRADRLDDSVADAAAAAAEAAFDRAADALGDTTSGAGALGESGRVEDSGGGGGAIEGGQNMMVPRSMGGRAFFSSVMVGYAGGLLVACAVNIATGTGQPALVYLVPATLGSVAATAVSRGELDRLIAFKEPEKKNSFTSTDS